MAPVRPGTCGGFAGLFKGILFCVGEIEGVPLFWEMPTCVMDFGSCVFCVLLTFEVLPGSRIPVHVSAAVDARRCLSLKGLGFRV